MCDFKANIENKNCPENCSYLRTFDNVTGWKTACHSYELRLLNYWKTNTHCKLCREYKILGTEF